MTTSPSHPPQKSNTSVPLATVGKRVFVPLGAKLTVPIVILTALVAWAEAGRIRPNVSHRLPMEDHAKAMQLLIERKAIGRVALMMG